MPEMVIIFLNQALSTVLRPQTTVNSQDNYKGSELFVKAALGLLTKRLLQINYKKTCDYLPSFPVSSWV